MIYEKLFTAKFHKTTNYFSWQQLNPENVFLSIMKWFIKNYSLPNFTKSQIASLDNNLIQKTFAYTIRGIWSIEVSFGRGMVRLD